MEWALKFVRKSCVGCFIADGSHFVEAYINWTAGNHPRLSLSRLRWRISCHELHALEFGARTGTHEIPTDPKSTNLWDFILAGEEICISRFVVFGYLVYVEDFPSFIFTFFRRGNFLFPVRRSSLLPVYNGISFCTEFLVSPKYIIKWRELNEK